MLRDAGFGGIRAGNASVFPFVPPEGIAIGALADRVGVRQQTMAEAVAQLERAGYVQRQPNPRDARSRLVVLTDLGEAARPVAVESGRRVEERWAGIVGKSELDDVRGVLRSLVEGIQGRGGDETDRWQMSGAPNRPRVRPHGR